MSKFGISVRNGVSVGLTAGVGTDSLISQAIAVLRKFGTDAHAYIPGIGAVSGLTAGNYLENTFAPPVVVDGLVGGVLDAVGSIHATASGAARPTLRLTSGRYSHQYAGAQSLALDSVPFQMADDHAVIVCANVNTSAADCIVFRCYGAGGIPVVGMLKFTLGLPDAVWRDDAANLVRITGASSVVGTAVVLALRKVGNAKSLWMNGVQVGATENTVMGATTLNGAVIGQTGISTNWMQGTIGNVIPIKGTLTDADLITLMRYAASNFPNAPLF